MIIDANNVTIKDCTFTGTTGFWAVDQGGAYSGATVENCTFIGSKSPTENNVWITSTLGITIKDNTFLNSPADTIDIQHRRRHRQLLLRRGISDGSARDAIYVPDTTGPITITNNFIDETQNAGATGLSNSDIRITNEFGNTNNVTVSGNYLLGAGFNVRSRGSRTAHYTISNVSITNNYIGFGTLRPILSRHRPLCDRDREHDRRLLESRRFDQALAAYVAAGVPTPNVVSGPARRGWRQRDRCRRRSWATAMCQRTWVRRAPAKQILSVAPAHSFCSAARARTFSPISPSAMAATCRPHFDPAKDVIDLSRIDGDMLTAGVQNFTFIGSAPFSGGAEVRYQLDPTNNDTLVQVALAGDTTADFTITLEGLSAAHGRQLRPHVHSIDRLLSRMAQRCPTLKFRRLPARRLNMHIPTFRAEPIHRTNRSTAQHTKTLRRMI